VKKTLFLPSIADVIFLSIFFIILFVFRLGDSSSTLLGDGDTGHHIRAGEVIIEAGRVPQKDIFSFIEPPLDWVDHSWLSEVFMAFIHRLFGLTGIVIVFAVIIAATFRTLFVFLRQRSTAIVAITCLTVLAAASSWLQWHARPHAISLFLTMIWYIVLEDFQYRDKNRLYWLPLLHLVWINLHGGFIIGLILLGIYTGGNLLEWLSSGMDRNDLRLGRLRRLAIIFLICVAISVVNPQGYRILLFPFKLTSDDFLLNVVVEHLSPNFHGPLYFKYYLMLLIGTLAVSRVPLNWIELALTVLFTYMALYSARYIPLFAIIIAPIWVRLFDRMFEGVKMRIIILLERRSTNLALFDSRMVGGLWSAIGISAVCYFAVTGALRFTFDPKIFPVKAAEFMRQETIPGNMFNDPEFGDYFIFSVWPQYKVFADGRTDVYGPAIGRDYFKFKTFQPGWENVATRYNITWVIDRTSSELSTVLKDRTDWRLIYADQVAALYVKNIAMYQSLIRKYGGVSLPTSAD
jgi:hypothetical protein